MDTVDPAVGLGLGYLWPHQTCGKMKEAILTHRLGTRGGGGGGPKTPGESCIQYPLPTRKAFPPQAAGGGEGHPALAGKQRREGGYNGGEVKSGGGD